MRVAPLLVALFLALVPSVLRGQPPSSSAPPAAPGAAAPAPPTLDPFQELSKAQGGVVYQTEAKALCSGESERRDRPVHYQYRLPKGFAPKQTYNLVIVFHPDNADCKWGFGTHDPATFRPDDIVICPEGSSPVAEGFRAFFPEAVDAVAMRDFVLEMSRAFPTRAIILYGHREGGQFVTWLGGEFPRMIDGIVASSSAAWDKARTRGSIHGVPIVFQHGTADTKIPYRSALLTRDAYVEDNHPRVAFRRLQGADHKPQPAEASRCIDWCIGMRTDEPEVVLACARRIAAAQDGRFAPPLGMANRVLKRILEPQPQPALKEFDEATRREAWDLSLRIEKYAMRHVEILRGQVKAPGELKLDANTPGAQQAWIGHLCAVIEDLRGLECVESYFDQLELHKTAAEHAEKAAEVIDALTSGETLTVEKVTAVVEGAPDMFLYDGFTTDFFEQFEQVRKRSDRNRDQVALKAGIVLVWRDAIEAGRNNYQRVAREWK